MTAEDLIKILQAVTPSTEVFVSLGDTEEERSKTIKAEMELDTLHVESVLIYKDDWDDDGRCEVQIAQLNVRKY